MAVVYEELVDFIAHGSTPEMVANFTASDATKQRVADLIEREKDEGISAEEKLELDYYMQLEHVLSLAKAKARLFLKAS